MLSGLKNRARNAARAVALTTAGVVFGIVGLGLLTVALWILVAAHEGALIAFAVTGGLYVVLSFIFIALGTSSGGPPGNPVHDPHTAPPPQKEPLVQVAEGFAIGLQAGRAARETRG